MRKIILLFLIMSHYSYGQDTTLTKRQLILLDILQNKRMPNKEQVSVSFDDNGKFLFKDYQHPLIKNEIIRLLDTKWTEKELNAYASVKEKKPKYLDVTTKYILKKQPNRSYQEVYDSLALKELNENKKNLIKIGLGVQSEIIQLAGFLYLRESISLLKKGIKIPERYNISFTKLALARMEVEPYYSELLQTYNPENIIKGKNILSKEIIELNVYALRYVGTQKALQQLEKWLYIEKDCDDNEIVTETEITAAITYTTIPKQAVFELSKYEFPVIYDYKNKDKNVFSRFNERDCRGISRCINNDDINFVKKYFKENKGKLKVATDLDNF